MFLLYCEKILTEDVGEGRVRAKYKRKVTKNDI